MPDERISSLDMSTHEVIEVMAGGNLGAITVCVELIKRGGSIDPEAFAGGVTHLLNLDSLGVYEEDIWYLFKDVCGENLNRMIAVLRANQLGLGVTDDDIHHAINNRGEGLDVEAVEKKVANHLSGFSVS